MGLFDDVPGAGSGDFKPIMKYNSKAGRLYKVERFQDAAGQWDSQDTELVSGSMFVVDFHNIEVGYLAFIKGRGPDFRMCRFQAFKLDKSALPAQPTGPECLDDKGHNIYKPGFRFDVLLPENLGGDVRVLSATAAAVRRVIDRLHEQYEAAPEATQGKLPVVEFKGGVPTGENGNFEPVFVIHSWVDRPTLLPLDPAQAAPAQAATPAAATPAQAAPATQAAPGAAIPQQGFGTGEAPAQGTPTTSGTTTTTPAADAPVFG